MRGSVWSGVVPRLDAVADQIAAGGGQALALPGDVSKEPDVEAAVAKMIDAWGGHDVCVGPAGIEPYDQGDASVDRLDLVVWNDVININLTTCF